MSQTLNDENAIIQAVLNNDLGTKKKRRKNKARKSTTTMAGESPLSPAPAQHPPKILADANPDLSAPPIFFDCSVSDAQAAAGERNEESTSSVNTVDFNDAYENIEPYLHPETRLNPANLDVNALKRHIHEVIAPRLGTLLRKYHADWAQQPDFQQLQTANLYYSDRLYRLEQIAAEANRLEMELRKRDSANMGRHMAKFLDNVEKMPRSKEVQQYWDDLLSTIDRMNTLMSECVEKTEAMGNE